MIGCLPVVRATRPSAGATPARARRRESARVGRPPPGPAASGPGASGPAGLLELQRLAGNGAVTQALRRATAQRQAAAPSGPSSGPGAAAAPKRATAYLGLNPGAEKEAKRLREMNRGKDEEVLVSLNDPEAEKRLQEDPAVFDFVTRELGIEPLGDFPRFVQAWNTLTQADPHAREQLADLMRWFLRAERGEIVLERVVLSGHSNGVQVWGELERGRESQPGVLLVERDLGNIAAVFPTAAGQVQDVMFSACYSLAAVELVRKIFPNLQTAWSYSGYSPSVKQGSPAHVAAWAAATEGVKTLKKAQKRGSSALWTRQKGYIVGDPAAAAVGPLYSAATRLWGETAEPMYDGMADVPEPSLRPVYAKIQELVAHPNATPEMRSWGAEHRELVLRLRHWPQIAKRFGQEYRDKLQPAYDALGMTQPDWGSLSRVAFRAHATQLTKALNSTPAAAGYQDLIHEKLGNGLWRLDPSIITADWM